MDRTILAWIYWNPERVVFTVPVIDRPVVWYGLWFVFGFVVGYAMILPMFKRKLQQTMAAHPERNIHDTSLYLVDRLTWFVVSGTIIGARLGHVFFYDWPRYQHHLIDILKVWEGGLASHGGAIGVLFAVFLYQRMIRKKFPEFTYIALLDMLVVPTAFVACCIRIGNFFNQEILGTPTTLPWAVVFGDPFDGSSIEPRHPVQLYEAGAYLFTFFLLGYLWRYKGEKLRPGVLSGLFFIVIFSSRFFIEFFKTSQSLMIDESFLTTGQYLSIPCVFFGIWLFLKGNKKCLGCFLNTKN